MQAAKRSWVNHGTKILGSAAVLIGVLAALDHEYLHFIADMFGMKHGPAVLHALGGLVGLATILRGVTNQQHVQALADTQLQIQQLQQQLALQMLEKQVQANK